MLPLSLFQQQRNALHTVLTSAPLLWFEFLVSQLTSSLLSRKQHATSLALAGLASSPELAKWGNELHSRVRRWQTAFTLTAVVLGLTVGALGYQTAVYHSGRAPFLIQHTPASLPLLA